LKTFFFGLLFGVFAETIYLTGALFGGESSAISKQVLIQAESVAMATDFFRISSILILGSSFVPEFGNCSIICFAFKMF
jgi:hypothetical protein